MIDVDAVVVVLFGVDEDSDCESIELISKNSRTVVGDSGSIRSPFLRIWAWIAITPYREIDCEFKNQI
jgi:hypothetical protein